MIGVLYSNVLLLQPFQRQQFLIQGEKKAKKWF